MHTPSTRRDSFHASSGPPAPLRIATACVEIADASPLVLLRSFPDARGFWARGERWVAHAGVLATISAVAGPDRFREVWEAARSAVGDPGPTWPDGVDPRIAGRLRFYGGFSFQNEPGASHLWDGFPPALFHLPAIELEGDAEGVARLRVRAVIREEEEVSVVRRRLEDQAAELAARLAGSGMAAAGLAESAGSPAADDTLVLMESDPGAWEAAVGRALEAIDDGRVHKVVLARTLDVHPRGRLDPVEVLGRLWDANHGTHVFYFEPSPERVVLGAAPETVATLRRGVFHATAVAGTIRHGATPQEQDDLAVRLMASTKDREEHRIAVEDMVERLEPLAPGVRAEPEPHVLTLPGLQHLETEIRARVAEGTTVLELLAALHPTPAVCGRPRDGALELVAHGEPFERGWYAGPVGWFDLEGNGVFAPALRSAVLADGAWRLFAGAGIVDGSRAESEWVETGIKFEAVLAALRSAASR